MGNIILQKGLDYNATYSSLDYPVLVEGWTGSISFYTSYPGRVIFSKELTVANNVFVLSLSISEILNLSSGLYSVVAVMKNTNLGVEISSLEYATVAGNSISDATQCRIKGTIININGTPVGYEGTELMTIAGVLTNVKKWIGVEVAAYFSNSDLDPVDPTKIIAVSEIKTTTNASGYFELYVMQGFTYSVYCKNLNRSLTIDTRSRTDIDISEFF